MSNSRVTSSNPVSLLHLWNRAAHDLRQPIQSLLLQTTIIAGTEESAERQKQAQHMEDMLIELQSMLNDLGSLSRLQAGVDGLSLVRCSLPDIAASVANSISPITAERNVTLTIAMPPISIASDARLLKKIVTGLVLNSVQLCSGTEVVLGARQARDGTFFDIDFAGALVLPAHQALAFIELRASKDGAAIRRTALGLGFIGQLAEALGATISHVQLAAEMQRLSLVLPSDVSV